MWWVGLERDDELKGLDSSCLSMDGANRHDTKLLRVPVDSLPLPRLTPNPEHPQRLCLDKGYYFAEVRRILDEFGFTAYIRGRGEEAKAITQKASFHCRRNFAIMQHLMASLGS